MNHTVQRDAILKELRMNHDHPTADKLYENPRKKLPSPNCNTLTGLSCFFVMLLSNKLILLSFFHLVYTCALV